MKDNRKAVRIKEKLIVLCEMPKGGTIENIETSEDISEGGIKISIPKGVTKEDFVTIKICLFNDSIPIATKGKVVWKKGLGLFSKQKNKKDLAGLQFVGIDEQEKLRLSNYIKNKASRNK